MNLLHIDSSLLPETSVSRAVAATFRQAWEEEHPHDTVAYRDLAAEPVPQLSSALVVSRSTDPADRTPEQARAAAVQEELIDELLAADAYLFSVPMYNWGLPSHFKAWLDNIVVPGRMFGGEGAPPLQGRPATLVTSRGGSYRPGTPREGWDFVDPYLELLLRDVLAFELRLISVELQLAHVNPALAEFRDQADASRERAHAQAAEQARAVAARLRETAA